MSLRQLRYKDDAILRKKCGKVNIVDDNIREILNDMAETMYSYPNGAGLAANQIGILKRLVVIDVGDGLLKLINPEIIMQAGIQRGIEGCLSFPNEKQVVIRPRVLLIKALDENGKAVVIQAEDKLAKCLSHEIDHLDGVLFIDKATNKKR